MNSQSVVMFAVSRFIDNEWELFGLYPDRNAAEKIKGENNQRKKIWKK